MFSIPTMPVIGDGDSAWHDALINEKIVLAKDLGRIDKRLCEIEIELGSMGTKWNDSFQERNPEPVPVWTLEGDYTHEFWDAGRIRGSTWYTQEKELDHRALVMVGVEVWPIKETEKSRNLFTLSVEASTRWRSPYAFALDTTRWYDMQSRNTSAGTHYESIIFVEYGMGKYVGFLVRVKDVQLVKFI